VAWRVICRGLEREQEAARIVPSKDGVDAAVPRHHEVPEVATRGRGQGIATATDEMEKRYLDAMIWNTIDARQKTFLFSALLVAIWR
jgi:hypothetical protein